MRPNAASPVLLGLMLTALAAHAQPALILTRPIAAQGDLPSVRVMDPSQQLVFRVYYDSASEKAAVSAVPILADMYVELARATGASAGRIEWAAVAFVTDRAYTGPRIGTEVRWTVNVESSGALGGDGERDLYVTVPHEQVHAIQKSMVKDTPRWFSEGQAEWAGLIVTDRWRPALGHRERQQLDDAFGGLPRRLAAWGGISVDPQAILRQMTDEQRAHHARDSTYLPPGPWQFGPTDMLSDESNTRARYGSALALFSDMERVNGRKQLENWFSALWKDEKPLTTEAIVASARAALHTDLTARLQ